MIIDKEDLTLKISESIEWNSIVEKLEFDLDCDINIDNDIFCLIEETIADMLLDAIKEDDNFTINE